MSECKNSAPPIALTQHIANQQKVLRATGEFSAVLSQIGLAAKMISRALGQGGLFKRPYPCDIGSFDKRIDVFANEAFINVFSASPWPSTLVTNDMENAQHRHTFGRGGKYTVFVDALNGSMNLSVNGVVGSIFSIHRYSEPTEGRDTDLLRKGSEQVAAGYIMYGPCTVMVYSSGAGVNLYTLDSSIGEFLITQEDIRIPERGLTYSCNEASFQEWPEFLRRYVEHLRKRDPKTDRYYSARFAGSLVFNFHRTLLEGGVCFYPAVQSCGTSPKRLMFECNPLAFVAEQAGGRASSGMERIVRIMPETLGQQTALVIGSPFEVALYEDFAQGKR
jgi:fructose-1,6-bisphosphatase I